MSWQPLLNGSLRDRALECIEAIAADVVSAARERRDDAFLAGGLAGEAILHGYRAATTRDGECRAIAERCLRDALGIAAASPMRPSLYAGLAGIAWAASHLHS